MFSQTTALWIEETRYNPLCDVGEECSSDLLSEELNIDSDDEIALEIEGEAASEESSNEMSESESESETNVLCVGGWEDVTMGDKKPKARTFTKMQGHNLTFCEMQSPWIIFYYCSVMSFEQHCYKDKHVRGTQNCGTSAKPKVHLE
jgi:hypothetical protein